MTFQNQALGDSPSVHVVGSDASHPSFAVLSSCGVSCVIECAKGQAPAIAYWGESLDHLENASAGEFENMIRSLRPAIANNGLDTPARLVILPSEFEGWLGTPGVSGSRTDSTAFSLRLECQAVEVVQPKEDAPGQPAGIKLELADRIFAMSAQLSISIHPGGLLSLDVTIRNDAADGQAAYRVDAVRPALPIPARASELLDFSGHWSRERLPQRSTLSIGKHERDNYRGRTGADSAFVLHAGVPGFGFQHGEVWALHTGWSGNHSHFAEHTAMNQRVLGGGEILRPGEVILGSGMSYKAPTLYASFGQGLDCVARRFHDFVRARNLRSNGAPSRRPVTLNVWEAVYFDHNLERLTALAKLAAEVGIERYVLDDGWFGGRRHDKAGLGDWVVSPEIWPNGLEPLIETVNELGMEFGLWFEPEMVNLDSDVARAHPEWVMTASSDRLPPSSRSQQVLNLAIPEAFDYIYRAMCNILDQHNIGYIKWDQNRDLVENGFADSGKPGTHAQTAAAYRLMEKLQQRYPELEIEACASGGSRVDLGVLEFTDRVWASDCIDPLERAGVNYWTSQLLPPEFIGSHVASEKSHTTGRRHSLDFRASVASMFHYGVEWDITALDESELNELKKWISWHKEIRSLTHTGNVVRPDYIEPAYSVYGVATDDTALFAVHSVGRLAHSNPAPLQLPGFSAQERFTLTWLAPGGMPSGFTPSGASAGEFSNADPVHSLDGTGSSFELVEGTFSGEWLSRVGIAMPIMHPEQSIFLRVEKTEN